MTNSSGLATLRAEAGVTQAQMAERMGLPLRTYEDIEAGRSTYRTIHVVAAEMALLQIAVEKQDASVLHRQLRDFAEKVGAVVAGNNKPAG